MALTWQEEQTMKLRKTEKKSQEVESNILWSVERGSDGTRRLSLYEGASCTTIRLNRTLAEMLGQMLTTERQ